MKNPSRLKKRGKIWYVRFQRGGHEQWISTHKTSMREAVEESEHIVAMMSRKGAAKQVSKKVLELAKMLAHASIDAETCKTRLADIERLAVLDVMPVIDSMIPAPPLRANSLLQKYLASNPKVESSTLHTRKQRANTFIRWAKNLDMRQFGKTDAMRFLKSLNTESASTWKNYISDLSCLWQSSPDLVNPWDRELRKAASAKAAPKSKSCFSIDEMRQIKTYLEEKIEVSSDKELEKYRFWHFFLILSFHTFLRLKDAVFANAFNIRTDGYYDFAPAKTGGKTKERKVAAEIVPQLRQELDSLTPDKNGYYFPAYVEKYQSTESGRSKVNKEFIDILKELNLYRPGAGTHSMRHGGITLALDAGNDAHEVAAIAGHGVELTTGTYYHGRKKTHLENYPTL